MYIINAHLNMYLIVLYILMVLSFFFKEWYKQEHRGEDLQ